MNRTILPKLRFPEFQDAPEWENKKLEEVSIPVVERIGDRKLTPVSISAGIGFVPQVEKFGRDISGKQYHLYTLVRDGDFVYNKGNSIKFPQGCVYNLRNLGEVAAPNVFICFRLKGGYLNDFFQNCFEKNMHGIQLKKHITSGARSNGLLNISKDTFFGIGIPTPSTAEQKKIADCLTSLDDLIAAQSQKLESLKAYKKGLMQNLFPAEGESVPRLRFPEFESAGEWEEEKLGNISFFINERISLEKLTLDNYISTKNILSDYMGATRATKLPPSGSAIQFKVNDILISNIRPYLKKVWLSNKDGGASNDVIVVRAKEKITAKYLSFMLVNDVFIEYVMRGAKGVKMPRGDISLMKEYPLTYPSIPEQQRIAELLTALDEQISAQSEAMAALKVYKKGLMQGLFPSVKEI